MKNPKLMLAMAICMLVLGNLACLYFNNRLLGPITNLVLLFLVVVDIYAVFKAKRKNDAY